MISIYKITNKETGKCYIGQAQDVQRRWKLHCSPKSGCKKLKNAIQKYGKDAFEFKVLFVCSEKDADWYETLMISGYNSVEHGYNICPQGGSVMKGRKHSSETKQRMSDAKKGKSLSDETRQKMSGAKTGENNPNYGRTGEKNPMYGRTGEKHPMCKLTDAQREEIKTLYATGEYTQAALAKLYGVSHPHISRIIRG